MLGRDCPRHDIIVLGSTVKHMPKPQLDSRGAECDLPTRPVVVAAPISTPAPANRAREVPEANYSLPHTKLDLEGLSQQEKMDVWRAHFSGLFDVSLHNLAHQEFDASAEAYRVGQTVLGHYRVTNSGIRRTQKNLKLEREDLLVLRIHLAGVTRGAMGGVSFKMEPGRLTLFDFHQDYQASEHDADFVSLTFPYAALGYDPSKHAALLQLPVDSAVGRVIRSNLEMLLDIVPPGSVNDALTLADGFVGLMKGLITRDLRDETVFRASVRAREVAVRRYIEQHLREPELNADAICRAVGVSRPVLYRMFSEEGGLRRAVTRMRLERALEDLSVSPPERGAIGRISKHWCFHDQAHFTRLFRSTFGFNPSEALASALTMDASEAANDTPGGSRRRAARKQLIDLYT